LKLAEVLAVFELVLLELSISATASEEMVTLSGVDPSISTSEAVSVTSLAGIWATVSVLLASVLTILI